MGGYLSTSYTIPLFATHFLRWVNTIKATVVKVEVPLLSQYFTTCTWCRKVLHCPMSWKTCTFEANDLLYVESSSEHLLSTRVTLFCVTWGCRQPIGPIDQQCFGLGWFWVHVQMSIPLYNQQFAISGQFLPWFGGSLLKQLKLNHQAWYDFQRSSCERKGNLSVVPWTASSLGQETRHMLLCFCTWQPWQRDVNRFSTHWRRKRDSLHHRWVVEFPGRSWQPGLSGDIRQQLETVCSHKTWPNTCLHYPDTPWVWFGGSM